MERKTFIYDGEVFEEGELVLVNGKELMYCKGGITWGEKDAVHVIYAPRHKEVCRYQPEGDDMFSYTYIRSVANGDKIEHVYNPAPYNAELPIKKEEPITNAYLVDGWIICIALMIATLILKPTGLWSLSVLGVWLKLRHDEIEKIKRSKK